MLSTCDRMRLALTVNLARDKPVTFCQLLNARMFTPTDFVSRPMENRIPNFQNRPPSRSVRFGSFEVNVQTGELKRYGIRIKLAPQPLEVLLLLVGRAGQIVSREELQRRLWPEDVFVDFDRSLNAAVKKLRAALNDSPDAPKYIETETRQGYRFIAEVTEIDNPPIDPAPPAPRSEGLRSSQATALDHAHVVPAAQPTVLRRAGMSIILLILTGGLLFFAFRHFPGSPAPVAPPRRPNVRASIAILGFQNLSSHNEEAWLGTAVSQMLMTELQAGDQFHIIPEEDVSKAKAHLSPNYKNGYPRDALRELNKRLGSEYVVAGSYVAIGTKESGLVRLDMRLQETISGETLASIAVSGKQSEIFDVVKNSAREMKAKVSGSIGTKGDADWRSILPSNPEASSLYSGGLNHLRRGDNVKARLLLEKSIAIEPQFALSNAALAEAWQALGYDGQAQASAHKALSLAASLPENVRLKVEGQYYESEHDWGGAIPAYRHLFQDYPDDVEAGLKLASAQISAGELEDASSTIARLRSIETAYHQDARIELLEATLAAHQSDYQTQLKLAQEASQKAEAVGSQLLVARASLIEGWAMDDLEQLDGALRAYAAARQIFEKAGDTSNTATVLDDIGIILEKKADLASARRSFEDAQRLFRQIGDASGLAASLVNLGELDQSQGNLATAEDLYREALELFRKTDRKENEGAALNNLGGVLFERGEFAKAKKTYEEALKLKKAVGDERGIGYAKENLAAAYWVRGDLDQAATLLNESLRTLRELGDRRATVAAETARARILIFKHDLPAARRALTEATTISDEIHTRGDSAVARVLLTKVTLSEGQPEQVDGAALDALIADLHREQRAGDEMEAVAIKIAWLLENHEIDAARQSLETAKGLRNTTWLSNYLLMLASAEIDDTEGKRDLSRREIAAALAKADKVGCGACKLEAHLPIYRADLQLKNRPSLP